MMSEMVDGHTYLCCTRLPLFSPNDDDKGEMFKLWWNRFSHIYKNYPTSQKFKHHMLKRARDGGTIGFLGVAFELWLYEFLYGKGMKIKIGDDISMNVNESQPLPSNDFIIYQKGKKCEIEAGNLMRRLTKQRSLGKTIKERYKIKHKRVLTRPSLIMAFNLANQYMSVDTVAMKLSNLWVGDVGRHNLRGVLIFDRWSPVNMNPSMMTYWNPYVDNSDMPDALLELPSTKIGVPVQRNT